MLINLTENEMKEIYQSLKLFSQKEDIIKNLNQLLDKHYVAILEQQRIDICSASQPVISSFQTVINIITTHPYLTISVTILISFIIYSIFKNNGTGDGTIDQDAINSASFENSNTDVVNVVSIKNTGEGAEAMNVPENIYISQPFDIKTRTLSLTKINRIRELTGIYGVEDAIDLFLHGRAAIQRIEYRSD